MELVHSRAVADRPAREGPRRGPLRLPGEDLGRADPEPGGREAGSGQRVAIEYAARLRDEVADLRKETEALDEFTL